MKNVNKFLFALALGAISFGANAQDDDDDFHTVQVGVPEVILVDLEVASGSKNIVVGPVMTAPAEAGSPLDFTNATDNTIWLNYSSIVENNTTTRNVTAAITTGTLPTGVTLSVTAAADAGAGDGTVGTTAGAVSLTGTAQNVVTGIGSCYTGNGASSGHNLTYTVALGAGAGSYATLFTDNNTTVTVTYTITD